MAMSDKKVWDDYASRFTAYDEYRHLLPDLFDLLGDVGNEAILDVGCSNGLMCRLLAKAGAKMAGVDKSEQAIAMAIDTEREAPQGIAYRCLDATDLSSLPHASFDAAIAVNVLCSMGTDRAAVERTVSEVHGVLKEGGVFVVVLPHPAFEHRQRAPTRSRTFRPGYSHFNSGAENTLSLRIAGQEGVIRNVHWTIEDYFRFLRGRFVVQDVREPEPDAGFLALHPDIFLSEGKYPIYILFKAVKVAAN
jgi:SAM-dependent methyltransferase